MQLVSILIQLIGSFPVRYQNFEQLEPGAPPQPDFDRLTGLRLAWGREKRTGFTRIHGDPKFLFCYYVLEKPSCPTKALTNITASTSEMGCVSFLFLIFPLFV